jgi:hypothetical protein
MNIEKLTTYLWSAYQQHKDAEVRFAGEAKNKKNRRSGLKEDFLDLATELVAQGTLAQKTVVVAAGSLEDAEAEARKRHPRWLILDSKWHALDDGYAVVSIEEDPYYKPFTYVHPKLKIVFAKQVVDGSPWIDDEQLKRLDPTLYRNVTRIVNYDFMRELLYHANIDVDEIDERIEDLEKDGEFPVERVLIPLEELDSANLAALEDYIYPGKPSVKMAAPRKAKAEDLEDDDES